jgi:molybdopterin/thiamine biosynthesis adenylyltransferase
MPPELSREEEERYARQIGPGVLSREGQRRLKGATVLVTRVGGMGGPAATMLAMAGVGRLILAHGGPLESPDLNRQVLGSEAGLGLPRVEQFAASLRARNRWVAVETLDHEPEEEEAFALARRADLLLSTPPTFAERLRLNRAAVAASRPLIDAAQWGLGGTLAVVDPGRTACLACLYPETPPFEEHFPVAGAISSAIGSLAALEAIKILAGAGEPMFGRMLLIEGHLGDARTIELARRGDCPVCGSL